MLKIKLNIVLVVCLLHMLCKGQTTFNNYYKTGYNNFFSTNIFSQQQDSSHIVFNYIQDSASGRQDLALMQINKTGNLLLKKSFNIYNTTYSAYLNGLKQFIPATKSSFIGTCVTYTGSIATVILTKINTTTLDTIKNTFYYDGVYSYYLNSFLKFNDNKYYLIGNKSNATNQWPVIFHLDSNLAIVNIITVNNPINIGTNNAILNPITKKLIFSGSITYNSNKYNIGFIEADTLGVISNTNIISFNGVQGISQLKYSAFDNSYVFNGGKRTGKYGNNNMYRLQITKLNTTNLNVIWSKTYGSAAITNNCNGFVINNDGSIVTCGRYADSTSLPLMNYDTKAILLKVNALGDSLWMRQYNNYQTPPNPLNYFETFFGIEKTYDGGYIACGGVMNQPQAKAWIVKTDSLGCVNAGCGSVINGTLTTDIEAVSLSGVEGGISIYPNPANEVLNVEFITLSYRDVSIQIINTFGQLVQINYIHQQTTQLNVSELVSGVYFVKITSKNNVVSVSKFIKE